MCFLTTARPTEIRLLDEREIRDGVIHFLPTKTEGSSAATVDWPITPEIEGVLERARSLNKIRALPGKSAPVIQTRHGEHYTTAALREMWEGARAAAGHPEVTTRDIRPYAMVCAEEQGYDLRAIQQGAAHTTTATTEGYLDQYRDVVCTIRMKPPKRKT